MRTLWYCLVGFNALVGLIHQIMGVFTRTEAASANQFAQAAFHIAMATLFLLIAREEKA